MPEIDTGLIKEIVDNLARAMSQRQVAPDVKELQRTVTDLQLRLDRLESAMHLQNSSLTGPQLGHPSQEKFEIAEAIADSLFASAEKERACTFEPNGKPCDHCSMCNSRGF